MSQRFSMVMCFLSMLFVSTASAQNWSFDARKVGLGSPGGGENLASRMIDDEREYRGIVLPFGLIQVFRDFKKLNPSNDEFDLVRTIEFAAAPLHYTIGRDSSDSNTAVGSRGPRVSASAANARDCISPPTTTTSTASGMRTSTSACGWIPMAPAC